MSDITTIYIEKKLHTLLQRLFSIE